MNTNKQLFIDKYIAKPIAYLLNFVVRIVGQILSIDHSLEKEFKTIAICKFKGMGSILQASPMIGAIRKRYPKAQIIFVSTTSNKKILEKITWIDTIVLVDDSSLLKLISSNIKSLWFLIKARPEVYLDLEIYSDYSTLFTLFTLSTNRVGFYLRSSSFRMGIYTHMMFFNPYVPISNAYLQLAQLIGCKIEDLKTASTLFPLAKDIKPSNLKKRNYIVINPNASDLRLERRWHKDNFVELIRLILDHFPDLEILLVGSKGEQAYSETVSTAINNNRLVNTAGKTSIEELIEIIHHAKIMISNDTGPMHIAFSTNTPIICLFGPCSPIQYGMNEHAHIIYKKVYCSPCVHDFEVSPCKGDNVCMKLISTQEVFTLLKKLLENTEEVTKVKTPKFIYRKDDNILGKVNR